MLHFIRLYHTLAEPIISAAFPSKKSKTLMKPDWHIVFYVVIFAMVTLAPLSAHAESNFLKMEVQTTLKVINFIRGIEPNENGSLDVGIIYDPETSTSRESVQEIVKIIDKNAITKKGRVVPHPVSINSPINGYQIYIVAPRTSRGYNVIKRQIEKNKSVVISIGSDCVRQNYCALGVEKNESIKIYLNETVFDLTAYDLDSTLRYLAVKL